MSCLHYLIFINGDIKCYKLVGIYKTRLLKVRYVLYCSTVTWMLSIVHWDYDKSKAAINWHIFEIVESKSNFVRIWIQHDENWVYFFLIFFIIPDLYTSGWTWLQEGVTAGKIFNIIIGLNYSSTFSKLFYDPIFIEYVKCVYN